jgi:hypothetical protein
MFMTCSEQFRMRYIKKHKESFGFSQFFGDVDHKTHAANFKRKIGTGADLDVLEMVGIYTTTWDSVLEEEGEPIWDGENPGDAHDQGQLMVATYHELVSPTINPIKVEERFEQRFPAVPIPIVGYPDIEERDRVVERKTSKGRVSKPKAKWRLQGEIYSMVLNKPVEWSIITKQKTPQVCTTETDPGLLLEKRNSDAVLQLVQNSIWLINDYYTRYGPDREWPTNGTMHDWACSYCGFGPKYGRTCVAWRN